jgi:uncharacterized protein (DUF2249 family)
LPVVTNPVVEQLAAILPRTLRGLGDAGEPASANRLAAEAYVDLRHHHARAAERLNGVMPDLSRLEAGGSTSRRSNPMTDERILDVRAEPPVRRHAVIFEAFEALDAGGGFELVNDHDPKPLYYQFAAERPGAFTWDYIEEGPEVWRVRIGRPAAPPVAPAAGA